MMRRATLPSGLCCAPRRCTFTDVREVLAGMGARPGHFITQMVCCWHVQWGWGGGGIRGGGG